MNDKLPKQIGKYQISRLIGKGGMGEIFLARDPVFEREVALKRISSKLIRYPTIRKRFLSEAKIASQLAHPSIISIYTLHEDKEEIYYTMPYIEGHTLKEILRTTREKEKKGEPPHPIGESIPALIRIFLKICQAVDYTHSKGFLHRDLKAENMMVGLYGEVIILDWGIALPIGIDEDDVPDSLDKVPTPQDLTKPGKVVGTVGYMAPERALGQPATEQTDIYSLGVLLYQLLTLRLPFIRPSLKDFRKQMKHERWVEPQEVAPHRDIPAQLSHIAKLCLHPNLDRRFSSVKEVIKQLENYIEGCPEWIPTTSLSLEESADWEFQENVMLAKHMAVSRISSVMEWVMLMISKESYSGNTKLEATIEMNEDSMGIGLLLCIPKSSDRKGLEDGYCLWIGSKKHPSCTLFRSNVEVMHIPDIGLEPGRSYQVAVEKFENNFRVLLDDEPILSYVSHIPLEGGHLGVLFRNANFKMEKIDILLGSQNVMVNCLSVPDAFLTSKDYGKALAEYRRIAHSFKGRAEGREALFRAGITLLEQAKGKKTKENRQEYYDMALDEFGKLHGTPGAPLEYLGKSHVYRAEGELDEEIKCLELAIRQFKNHPLLPVVEEHIGLRLHETARSDRLAAYSFILLALLHVPHVLHTKETQHLIQNLTNDWERLSFIETPKQFTNEKARTQYLAIQLAFWLSKPTALYEILHKIPKDIPERYQLIGNALFALLEMGYPTIVDYVLKERLDESDPELLLLKNYLEIAIEAESKPLKESLELFFGVAPNHLSKREARTLKFLLEKGLNLDNAEDLIPFFEKLKRFDKIEIDLKPLEIWARLLCNQKDEAKKSFPDSSIDITSPYYPLQVCLLDNKDSHFESLLAVKHPPSTSLLSYFLKGAIELNSSWMNQAFLWEKIQLYRQLSLYHFCSGQKDKSLAFEKMIEKEQKKAQIPLDFL